MTADTPKLAARASLGLLVVAIIVLIPFLIARGTHGPHPDEARSAAPTEGRLSSKVLTPSRSRSRPASEVAQRGKSDAQKQTPSILTRPRLVAAPTAGVPASSARSHHFVDGVEAARAIDWNTVGSLAPIPRLMPTGSAADAVDAGFAPEWFERSIAGWGADTLKYRGQFASIEVQPLALQIMSESKTPEDSWANGVESQLRLTIANSQSVTAETISRVFCSGEGCLCYVEDAQSPVSSNVANDVLLSIRNDSWAQTYGITPLNAYRIGTQDWNLILIPRPK